MNSTKSSAPDKTIIPLIWTVSIIVPIVVGILLKPGLIPTVDLGFNPYLLAKLNAIINSLVAVCLVIGLGLIRAKKIALHRAFMLTAFGLSAIFLVSYVLYHLSVGHTPYCDSGLIPKTPYLIILISHILLSVLIIPMASFSIYRAWHHQYEKHRKLAKVTFPLWLYVAVTGVLVYLFISPCYPA